MGSSHAEPMLRNNVDEWTAPKNSYNYVTNREGVRAYWEQRVKENGHYENIYTLGMRGIHDSNMVGPNRPRAHRDARIHLRRSARDDRKVRATPVLWLSALSSQLST
jgi:hypothetical protein